MKSIFAAIVAVAAAVASAQTIVSSRPGANQVLVAGTSTNIVWAPVAGVIAQIDLRQGNAAALGFLNVVATSVNATDGTYTWNVPADLPAGADYALSFSTSPDVSYTPYFTIQAANGAAPASSGAATSAAATSAAATSVAATSAKPAATSGSASPSVKPSASVSAPAADASSGANKNVAAVGAMAVAGAVAAAFL